MEWETKMYEWMPSVQIASFVSPWAMGPNVSKWVYPYHTSSWPDELFSAVPARSSPHSTEPGRAFANKNALPDHVILPITHDWEPVIALGTQTGYVSVDRSHLQRRYS
ncbi:MAG TPA: hypothetical protein QF520_14085 [SAR202 cluster bacterium]|nr:hypothetical protein [SAR202 cluster bacterium]